MVNTPSHHEAPGENPLDITPVQGDVANVSAETKGKLTYARYRGELNADEYARVMSCSYDQDSYKMAMRKLTPFGLPDHSSVEIAAKLIATLKDDPRVQNGMWLFAETMTIQGKN